MSTGWPRSGAAPRRSRRSTGQERVLHQPQPRAAHALTLIAGRSRRPSRPRRPWPAATGSSSSSASRTASPDGRRHARLRAHGGRPDRAGARTRSTSPALTSGSRRASGPRPSARGSPSTSTAATASDGGRPGHVRADRAQPADQRPEVHPEGSVRLTLRPGATTVEVAVRDTGVGIARTTSTGPSSGSSGSRSGRGPVARGSRHRSGHGAQLTELHGRHGPLTSRLGGRGSTFTVGCPAPGPPAARSRARPLG